MKVLFVCGSLELGKDGVGDYTRRLAGELIRNGNSCQIISLNEKGINAVAEEIQYDNNTAISTLRLSSFQNWTYRINLAKIFINKFDPDWVSLQYVVFAYHKKGLPFALTSRLQKLEIRAKWHIMFHELWVSMDTSGTIKYKLWSGLQRYIIKKMLKILQPAIINTHTKLYQLQIKTLGFKAHILPLFGNINDVQYVPALAHNIVNIAIFGIIDVGGRLQNFVNWLNKYNNIKFVFHFVGHNGAQKEIWLRVLNKFGVDYIQHGWLHADEVSVVLANCKIGITSTPYYLVQKSGSVAAMLDHGLHVLCIARTWIPVNVNEAELVNNSVINWKGDLSLAQILSKKTIKQNSLLTTSVKFLKQLEINKI